MRGAGRSRAVRAACAALLLGALAPEVAAGGPGTRCDITQLGTLTSRLPQAPRALRAGKALELPVTALRGAGTAAELGAPDVEVLVGLTGADWGAYDQVLTDASGRATVRLVVPARARGAAVLDVELVRLVADLPCLTVEEHGRVTRPWGRVS